MLLRACVLVTSLQSSVAQPNYYHDYYDFVKSARTRRQHTLNALPDCEQVNNYLARFRDFNATNRVAAI